MRLGRRSLPSVVALIAFGAIAVVAPRSGAAEHLDECPSAVVVTLPGITWADVERVRPPHLLDAAEDGAVGSMAVRTIISRTSFASGFATIGAGTRIEGGNWTGGVVGAGQSTGVFRRDVQVSGLEEIEERVEEDGYDAQPGALAEALRDAPQTVVAIGSSEPGAASRIPLRGGRWALLAAMDAAGQVDLATDERILSPDPDAPLGVRTDPVMMRDAISTALADCAVVVVDPGDVSRADHLAALEGRDLQDERDVALLAADRLVGHVQEVTGPDDLLMIVSPTSPGWDPETHLGVAVVAGPGFAPGSVLRSGSTRAAGLVTLPDVAPTVLEHLGIDRPAAMLGSPFVGVGSDEDRIDDAVELDEEAVYSHGIQADLTTGFVIFQVILYLLIIMLLRRTEPEGLGKRPRLRRWLELGALSVVAFPLATYLASPLPAHAIGLAGLVPAMVAIVAGLVVLVSLLVRAPLYRLLCLTALTLAVMVVDLVAGGPLQFMAVFGNDPINAGRFAGLGNIAFAILGTCSVVTAAVLFHRWPNNRTVMLLTAALFVVTVIADGAPQLGSDVGGVLALVPALVVTFLLLTGRKPSWKVVALSLVGAVVALGIFLAIDLARPSDAQTHLGRFFDDIRSRGGSVFFDTIERKARTNLRIFGSTIWTYLVPPALGLIGYLLLRPRGRWQRLAIAYPRVRAGLIGGLVLAVLGFAVNDSGIVVPAMVLSYLVPMATLLHLALEAEHPEETAA